MDTVEKNKKTVVKSRRYRQCRRKKKGPNQKKTHVIRPSYLAWVRSYP